MFPLNCFLTPRKELEIPQITAAAPRGLPWIHVTFPIDTRHAWAGRMTVWPSEIEKVVENMDFLGQEDFLGSRDHDRSGVRESVSVFGTTLPVADRSVKLDFDRRQKVTTFTIRLCLRLDLFWTHVGGRQLA